MSIEKLAEAILSTSKYRHISPDLVRRIGEREMIVRRSQKEAIKATKNKLHQVGGAYFPDKIKFSRYLETLYQSENVPIDLQKMMQNHASTRERLPILEEFYAVIFDQLPAIGSIVDIACGLNPLAIPWMPFQEDVTYFAYDIYGDMMAFLGEFLQFMGVDGVAESRDVIGNPPTQFADLILILKTFPCLEQVDKQAAERLLDGLNGRYLLISYPARSLGGRKKNMVANYTAHFEKLADERNWQDVIGFEFETELAFLVETGLSE